MSKSERQFVEWLGLRYPAESARVPIGIGDDMAAVRLGGDTVLVTADMLMDGVDFVAQDHGPEQIGRKALACGLSDCAAMAVRPVAAIVSVALPNSWTMQQAQQLYLGMEPLAQRHEVAIVGGDTNSWDHPLVIDVSVLAEPWPGAMPVRRGGARPGDKVYVSGMLGGSLLGRHLAFEPRVEFARLLRGQLRQHLHALIDISDGLSLDLSRICEASGFGAELWEEDLLAHGSEDAHRAACADGRSVEDHLLHDGEDYELICVVDPSAHVTGLDVPEHVCPQWSGVPIGHIVEPRGLTLISSDRRRRPLEPRGWEHFREV